jgi:hypothetical protein
MPVHIDEITAEAALPSTERPAPAPAPSGPTEAGKDLRQQRDLLRRLADRLARVSAD